MVELVRKGKRPGLCPIGGRIKGGKVKYRQQHPPHLAETTIKEHLLFGIISIAKGEWWNGGSAGPGTLDEGHFRC